MFIKLDESSIKYGEVDCAYSEDTLWNKNAHDLSNF